MIKAKSQGHAPYIISYCLCLAKTYYLEAELYIGNVLKDLIAHYIDLICNCPVLQLAKCANI